MMTSLRRIKMTLGGTLMLVPTLVLSSCASPAGEGTAESAVLMEYLREEYVVGVSDSYAATGIWSRRGSDWRPWGKKIRRSLWLRSPIPTCSGPKTWRRRGG